MIGRPHSFTRTATLFPDPTLCRSDDADADRPAPIADAPKAGGKEADDQGRQYDFYTVLPGQEVAMSDAELAASARAEAARKQQAERAAAAAEIGRASCRERVCQYV